MGSLACLNFGASTLIISIDWITKQFVWTDRAKCALKLGVKDDQFVDISLLSGLSILAPFPRPDIEMSAAPMFPARDLLMRSNYNPLAACDSLGDDSYRLLFQKAKAAVSHAVWMDYTGATRTRQGEMIPRDLHDVFGQRLPDEMYYYLSRGIVGPRMLNWRTRLEIFEVPPLDGGNSQAYQQLVSHKLAPLRSRSMALMSRSLHNYYQKKDVELVCWFDESKKRALDVPDALQSSQAADRWHVKHEVLAHEMLADKVSTDVRSTLRMADTAKINITSSPLTFAVKLLSANGVAKQTITELPKNSHPLPTGAFTRQDELLANATFRFLEDRDYINNDHTLSAWGKALSAALGHASTNGYLSTVEDPREVEEAIFMAFELHRLDALNSTNMFPAATFQGAPQRGSDTDKASTLLLSRIASLGSFHHNEIGFTGPLSRHLLAYHQIAAAVRGSLRDLLEMHALNMLLKGAASRNLKPTDYSDFGSQLGFLQQPDLGLSLVVKSYLDEINNDKQPDISKWFNHAADISGDLDKAWKMWGAVCACFETSL